MKKYYVLTIGILLGIQTHAANIFHDRSFWQKHPSIQEIEVKIAAGNDIAALDKFHFDGLSWAILTDNSFATLKYLLNLKGNSVNKRTHDGRTYIFWAAYRDNLMFMEYLKEHGAQTDIIDSHGYSLLNFAAVAGQLNTKVYDFCIKNGSQPTKEFNHDGANALLLIAPHIKEINTLEYFISKGLSLESKDNLGNGIFNYMVKGGNIDMLSLMVEKGLPYAIVDTNGENAFFKAATGLRRHQNSNEVYEYLEKLGLPVTTLNKKGQNFVHIMAKKQVSDKKAWEYVTSLKGVIAVQDTKGVSPLMLLLKNGQDELFISLVQKGIQINNQVDNEGNTLYHYLQVNTKTPETLTLLNTKIKEQINQKNQSGLTPFHKLVMNNKDIQGIKIWISYGANPNIETDLGETTYQLALENKWLSEKKEALTFLK